MSLSRASGIVLFMPDRTPPLEGDDLFGALCGRGGPRPTLDPSLIALLRARLEEAAAPAADLPDDVVVRVSKHAVERVRRCEARHLAELAGDDPEPSAPLVRGRLLDAVFRQVVTTGVIGADPVADAIAACVAEGDATIAAALEALPVAEQTEVRADVVERSLTLAARWPTIPPEANLRTQERSAVRLAGGRVLLTSRPDVTFGRVIMAGSRVCLVEAKSGTLRPAHHNDLRFYALVEALRWGAPPLRASTYAMADGRVASLIPDDGELVAAADTAADAVRRLVRLAAGDAPRREPNPLCPSCPLVSGCGEGQRQLALTHGAAAATVDDDDRWDPDDASEDDAA
jgi:hypothetical protein